MASPAFPFGRNGLIQTRVHDLRLCACRRKACIDGGLSAVAQPSGQNYLEKARSNCDIVV